MIKIELHNDKNKRKKETDEKIFEFNLKVFFFLFNLKVIKTNRYKLKFFTTLSFLF